MPLGSGLDRHHILACQPTYNQRRHNVKTGSTAPLLDLGLMSILRKFVVRDSAARPPTLKTPTGPKRSSISWGLWNPSFGLPVTSSNARVHHVSPRYYCYLNRPDLVSLIWDPSTSHIVACSTGTPLSDPGLAAQHTDVLQHELNFQQIPKVVFEDHRKWLS